MYVRVGVQCKRKTADCGLRTAECGPGVKCRQSVRCRLQTESKMQAGCKMQKWRLLVLQIVTIAKSSMNIRTVYVSCLSLRSLIFNPFIEDHPNFLQNIFLCCWNDLLPFFMAIILLNSLCNSRSRVSKTSRIKLKLEVSRTEKRFKIAITNMFLGCRGRSREERNGFVKADVVK